MAADTSANDPAGMQPGGLWALDPVGEPSETISTDLLVIGGGGAGIAAAIQAGQKGLKTILVEKSGTLGGAWVCTEGMFAVGSRWQGEMGVDIPVEEIIEECMEFNHYLPRYSLYNTFFSETAATVDWAESLGAQYAAVVPIGISQPIFHVWAREEDNHGSPAKMFFDTLAAKAQELGAEVMLGTAARRVLTENNKVIGAIVERGDGTITKIEAGAVIIASGGYGQNKELLKTLTMSVLDPIDLGVPGRDGDGIKMGVDAGAALWKYPGTVPCCGPVVRGTEWGSYIFSLSVQPTLWLNQDCDRVVREDVFIDNFAFAGNAIKFQERLLNVFTDADLAHFESVGTYVPVFTFVNEETPMGTIRTDLEQVRGDYGSVYVADSLDDLAAQAGLDAAKLKASVQRYNELCEKGIDEDFGKKPQLMHPLTTGPYYALDCQVGSFGSCGGLHITDKMECVDADRRVIDGLYAAGNDASGLYGDAYDANIAPGTMAGWALTSGRLAASHAAEYLG
jgi:fumarate reductase flavoprotein subunit